VVAVVKDEVAEVVAAQVLALVPEVVVTQLALVPAEVARVVLPVSLDRRSFLLVY
jgi:hypothetical protein